ncbi:PREDICTED: DNA polymerase epsilon catalytic subunit A isoform X2 [Rhagoletis zephyria]|uniref:DNA polymerase epsilon catalytic subunit A isoform X1 n=1 Tax=Rhagoletis zephyria TaxID=28612 RepID=UPI000811517D|nr:PREDICTED: DNA polymerase epsilon catalytic subunit A isoform X1 [Rhagoletis zephyria]XP_017476167.1 PREDICTED: DNA polymerase epsilon catalytic subunit A isoform X2 [Rhagoletis zephyria]
MEEGGGSRPKVLQNTGKFTTDTRAEGDDFFNEAGYRQSRENDKIDSKYGFDRIKDSIERTGYLINMHSTEILDEDRRLVAALDLFFIQMDGSRFKCTVAYKPYLLIRPEEKQSHEVARFLSRKYSGQLAGVEHVNKEDLDLPNHLIGKQQHFLKLSFLNQTAMTKVRRELAAAVRRNVEREKSNTFYMQMLSSSLAGTNFGGDGEVKKQMDYMDLILDIREHDVPYHVRVSIDLSIFCGQWYNIRCRSGGLELPIITPRPDLLERPEPVVLAFDIETTKLPLKFPDAQTDQVMMISYMIDGQGYLITNREIISTDVDDFEYTPKPEFEGHFIVFNEEDEMHLIQKFFDHIMEVRPHIVVTYNGDFFDWPFVETRAAVYDLDMQQEIGFSKLRDGFYLSRPAIHMDCLCWVKRDSYLPVGSQGLKAVAKAKLRYDPVELDPEDMCRMAVEQPQVLSNYSVSDAVATYYLYMKYVHPFIFALNTIIPMEPDEILRKGSGTLCETLLMVQAYRANIVYPNKQQNELNKLSNEGHVLDSETYVGGHVEALESGVFRADIPCRFRLDPNMVNQLKDNVTKVLVHSIEVEEGVPIEQVTNLDEINKEITQALQGLHDIPNRLEQPVIYHLDVGAMYPNIILTNRLQPSAMVSETDCAACDFNKPGAKCKRVMDWLWRGEMLPATRNEFQRIQQQLETEKFPPLFPGGPTRAFHELSREDQAAYEKKRLSDYCRKAYKKTKITKLETRTSTVCEKENSFYVDTVRAFRDRRYEYKGLTKVAKAAVNAALTSGDATEIKAAKGREVLYDSLQLAHKCILNSFYGYVMRRGARWHSMPMAGIVCLTGSNIITKAREIIERVGRPLELDTDGIWCILPGSFPQEFTVHTTHEKKKKFNISYPNAVLNTMVKEYFTNDQYHELVKPAQGGKPPEYVIREENSIFFEVDGPYLAMVLPAAKEEGKKLKKRYAVFNFDGSLAELKGFEVKRRGELQLIKNFQSSVFEAFLAGNTLEECYASVAKVADYWLDVLYSRGSNLPDSELFDLIAENKSMSKKLEDYGEQKSTSISTAKRLAEFLGDQIVKDAGLACKYIISKKPEGAPVTERAIPLAIFQSEPNVRRYHLRRWLKDNTMGDADIRDVLDWNYYIERLGGTIQKIITIPAALQGLPNPVPRVQHPDWLHKKILEKNDVLKQRRINEMFMPKAKTAREIRATSEVPDMEDLVASNGAEGALGGRPVVTKRKRVNSGESDEKEGEKESAPEATTWRQALGAPPPIGTTRAKIIEWVRFQKKKWAWQLERRQRVRQANKRPRNEQTVAPLMPSARDGATATGTIGGFLRRAQRALIDHVWHVLQIVSNDDMGHFTVWLMIGDELHRIKLTVPRIFYVNQRNVAPPEDGQLWKKVNRILPRARPVYNLYRYSVPEQVFKDNCLGMLADLATPDIEGIYETQMSLEFRALMDMGCMCSVQRQEAQRLVALASKDLESFSIEQLEQRLQGHIYLKGAQAKLRKIFLYQHNTPTAKKEIWGLFLLSSRKALIFALDTVRTNQMPNMRTLYTAERLALIKTMKHVAEVERLPPEEFTFEVLIEVDVKQIYRHIQRALTAYKEEKRGPSMLYVQTATEARKLNSAMPILLDFPQARIHITDDASLLSGLDWQRQGSRALVRHFLHLNNVVEMMLDQCRYFQVPIGNMPPDTVLFGADLFFARILQRNNFVLWWSTTTRPDLGGREADDSRLLAEFEDSITVVQNRPGFYNDVCVELALDSLAVSALLQSNRIQELEGASSAVTFDVIPQASLEEMIGTVPAATLPSYDETALCSAAFRVLRHMVNGWLREVALHQNIFADFQLIHFYRWVRSSNALLYDPALRRTLNNLMRKMFLRIIAEFKRLGATIIYADFNRIILSSGKKTVSDALGYVEYVVQSLRNKELFHSIQLSYEQCWNFVLWLDQANYAGIRGQLPPGVTSDTVLCSVDDDDEEGKKSNKTSEKKSGENDEDQDEDDIEEIERPEETDENGSANGESEQQLSLELNWTIGEHLPEENACRDKFETLLTLFMQSLAEGKNTRQAIKDISHPAFDFVSKLHKNYGKGRPSPGLDLTRTLVKALSVDKGLAEEVNGLRRNMLRLVGMGEFSDLAEWKDPSDTYTIAEVICKACNHCRDLDLCKDKHRAMKDGIPVWLCAQCFVAYENEEIEMRIIDVVQRKAMSYVLQDLRCIRCNEIKRENLAEFCTCAGEFAPLISGQEINRLLRTFRRVAEFHKMQLLQETVEQIIPTK